MEIWSSYHQWSGKYWTNLSLFRASNNLVLMFWQPRWAVSQCRVFYLKSWEQKLTPHFFDSCELKRSVQPPSPKDFDKGSSLTYFEFVIMPRIWWLKILTSFGPQDFQDRLNKNGMCVPIFVLIWTCFRCCQCWLYFINRISMSLSGFVMMNYYYMLCYLN